MTELERYEPQVGHLVAAEPDVDSWVHVLAPVGDLSAKIASTDFVPKDFRGKPAAVAAAILFGREVGLPPITTLKNTYVVHGTPDLSAEAQRALVLAAGHEIEFLETTATRCVMRARRAGSESWSEPVKYTMDEAKTSGDAAKNSNYRTRPQEMMVARCTSRLCSMHFPDVIGGFTSAVNAPLPAGEVDESEVEPPTVTVTQEPARKPPVRRKTKAAPKPLPAAESEPDGPPLPGEDGYDDLAAPAAEQPAEPAQADDGKPSAAQVKALHAALNNAGMGTREDKLRFCSEVVGHDIDSSKDLSADEVSQCLDVLKSAAGIEDAEVVDEPEPEAP